MCVYVQPIHVCTCIKKQLAIHAQATFVFFTCLWFRTNNTQNYMYAAKLCVHFMVNTHMSR